MRILIAASGGEGHLGPLLPFVDAAAEAGDDVVLVVPPSQEDTARGTGVSYRITAEPSAHELLDVRRSMSSGDVDVRTHAAEVEMFGRINTAAALPVMESVARTFQPHLVMREPCDYASAIIAVRQQISMATVGISPGRADVSGTTIAAQVTEPLAPGVTAAIVRSAYLTRFPDGDDSEFPDTRRYGFEVDTVAHQRESPPLIWLTMGTVNTGFDQIRGTWDAAISALDGLDVRVIASVGRGGAVPESPAHIEVVDWVELTDVLGRASAVLCHGGSGTTLAALAAGVPVVCVPMLADQPTNAAMVTTLGAGITVAPQVGPTIGGLTPSDVPRLRHAVASVLDDPSYRDAAERAASLFAGAPRVAVRLAELRREVVGKCTHETSSHCHPPAP